jgi:hypothetical protein
MTNLGGRNVKIVPNAQGMAEFRMRIASGLAAVMRDAELEAKRETPVRGAYRSFRPGQPPIGGTLRRSVHSAVFLDGRLTFHGSEDQQAPMAEMQGLPNGIVGFVGTNTGYGAFVELGTRRMTSRPFLGPGLDAAMGRAGATFTRGMGRAKP